MKRRLLIFFLITIPIIIICLLLSYFYLNSFTKKTNFQAIGIIELIKISNIDKLQSAFETHFTNQYFFNKTLIKFYKEEFIKFALVEDSSLIKNIEAFNFTLYDGNSNYRMPIIHITYIDNSSKDSQKNVFLLTNLFNKFLRINLLHIDDVTKIIEPIQPTRAIFPNFRNKVFICIFSSITISIFLSLIILLYIDKKNGIITPLFYLSKIMLELIVFIIIYVIIVYNIQMNFGNYFKYDRIYFGDKEWILMAKLMLTIFSLLIGLSFLFWFNSEIYFKNLLRKGAVNEKVPYINK